MPDLLLNSARLLATSLKSAQELSTVEDLGSIPSGHALQIQPCLEEAEIDSIILVSFPP